MEKLRKAFHKHEWVFEKFDDEIEGLKSGIYQTYYENPETKVQSNYPIQGYIVKERKLMGTRIFRCRICGEIEKYTGFDTSP